MGKTEPPEANNAPDSLSSVSLFDYRRLVCYNECMILIIQKKATQEELEKMAEDFEGEYIKVVADIEREILAGGGERHVDAEQILLKDGSKQENLWGGGIDPKTKTSDYNSMINLRISQDNPSRDILSSDVRKKFDEIIKKLLI